MNQYPLWRYVLIVVVLLVGGLYALPNLYGVVPAIEISAEQGTTVDQATQDSVTQALKTAGITPTATTLQNGRIVLKLADVETQLKALLVVKSTLNVNNFVVAQNLVSSAPAWLSAINAAPMYLGLDLRGGIHFLMEVDMDAAIEQAKERYSGDVRNLLRDKKIRYKAINRTSTGIAVKFTEAEERTKASPLLTKELPDSQWTETNEDGAFLLQLTITQQQRDALHKTALEQNITTLRNRVNELGVAEPIIQQQGKGRIVVQLPGLQDPAEAKRILGATATLEFRMVDSENDAAAAHETKHAPIGSQLYYDHGQPVLLQKRVMLTGEFITDAASGLEQRTGTPAVFITLDNKGGRKFQKETEEQVGRPMAILFIEDKMVTRLVDGKPTPQHQRSEKIISIARINERLGERFQVSGLDSTEEARRLALFLRAGALAAPMQIIEERTIGPSLGQDNIEQGYGAAQLSFLVVFVFMVAYYRVFGLIANLALALNVVLLVALLSMLQATLTLPGIAGIILTVGMAVDANVLIYERIREELRNGNTPQASIHAGYEKAFSTIADSNITTLIATAVLFSFGTGPVKGFAVTLSLGILTSMFTSITVTRAVVNLLYGGRRLEKLSV